MIEKAILNNLFDYSEWLNDCRTWDYDFNPDVRFPCVVYYCKTEANGYPAVDYLEESIAT